MYVPMDKASIIAQFDLSESEIEHIVNISTNRKQNATIVMILQEKRIIMPRNSRVLTAAGQRIKERLKA